MTFGTPRGCVAGLAWSLMVSPMLACSGDGPTGIGDPASPAAGLAFVASPISPMPSGSTVTPPVQVAATDSSGNTDAHFTGTITIGLDSLSPAGTLSGGQTAQAVRGIATFSSLRLTMTGAGYALTASATGRRMATSARFDVVRGAFLRFTEPPTAFVVNAPLDPVRVTAVDPDNPTHPFSGEMQMRVTAGASGALLSGTTRVTAVNGVATFDNLLLDKPGQDLALVVSAVGYPDGTSQFFNSYVSRLAFVVQPSRFAPGTAIAPAVRVRALNATAGTRTSFTGDVTVALGPDPDCGVLSGPTHATPVNGIASFTGLIVDRPAVNCTLIATAAGVEEATSGTFSANGALAFTTLPSSPIAGFPAYVVVTAQDALGGVDNTFHGTVTIALGAHPQGGTLDGVRAAQAQNGSAYFYDLAFSTPGGGYTLVGTADDPGVSGGVSAPITVVSSPWVARAPPPASRYRASGAVVNGIFYLVGGVTDAGWGEEDFSAAVEAYNPATNTWSTKASMISSRQGAALGVLDGRLYLVGGVDGYGDDGVTTDVYDPATNSWAHQPVLPRPRIYPGVASVNGRLYVFGGRNTFGQALSTVDVYDPVTNVWSAAAPMPTAHSGPAGAALNGILYVAGGVEPQSTEDRRLDAYDPVANTWIVRAPMPTVRSNAVAGVLGQELYMVGGNSSGTVEAFDPATNSWRSGEPLPAGQITTAGGIINGVIYAIVGNRLYAYQP